MIPVANGTGSNLLTSGFLAQYDDKFIDAGGELRLQFPSVNVLGRDLGGDFASLTGMITGMSNRVKSSVSGTTLTFTFPKNDSIEGNAIPLVAGFLAIIGSSLAQWIVMAALIAVASLILWFLFKESVIPAIGDFIKNYPYAVPVGIGIAFLVVSAWLISSDSGSGSSKGAQNVIIVGRRDEYD